MPRLHDLSLLLLLAISGTLSAQAAPRRAGTDWWSLQPLESTAPPSVAADRWSRNPIDRFVYQRLRRANLDPSPRAQPRALVRRLYIDVLGLPPPHDVVDRFVKDPSPAAWRSLVNDALASPHYGERWARHWLDVVRFGESNGYEYNAPRNHAWHYRDWLIRALNADLPYDEFARMQIAGDILAPQTLTGAAAVGMLVAGPHNNVLGKSQRMKLVVRHEALEEMAGAVAQTFLGLTLHCARCHDHKYDPLPTEDYYSFIAALSGVTHGERRVGGKKHRLFTVVPKTPQTMRVLRRGDVGKPGKEVAPRGVTAIRGLSAAFGLASGASDSERRRALATWISHRENGPFHRVIVNRVWHYHFGRGLVRTPSDLGFQGGRPSHPRLLEWLAVAFRESGYSLKKLHAWILTSATYQQSSKARPSAALRDPENRLLWRQNPRRVEGEVLRDSILAVAGQLDRTPFGPGFHDVRIVRVGPAFYYTALDPVGPKFHRRTIYRWQVRGQRSALLDTFDCPDPSTRTPTRLVTTTPAQALSQWNHGFVLRMARHLAQAVRSITSDVDRQVEHAWRRVLHRKPDTEEQARAARLVRRHGLELLARVLLNCNEFVVVD